jgi:hypothetical protein
MASGKRGITGAASSDGPRARVVDTLVLHQGLIDFRTLCERAVPPSTRYLVLDLDRTFHFGRNLGELLGWELCALAAYGEEFIDRAEADRNPSRFVFDRSRPLCVLHYLFRGARLWAYPGLFYFFAIKLGMHSDRVRPWLYRTFGHDPVETVQSVPRNALMHHLSDIPMETLRKLARGVWRRFEADQVIRREDLAWLRARCPGIHIVISSASPQPVLEVAAEELDVDEIHYTAVEEHDGYLSSPYVLSRLFLLLRPPRRISPPSRSRVNSGERKMDRLIELHPDFLDPDVETVGITDTSYGEDHAWADYFKVVVDINSPAPFAPIVSAGSPLREIHSAQVLTRAEREHPTRAAKGRQAARQRAETEERRMAGPELRRQLGVALAAVDRLSRRYEKEADRLRDARAAIEARLSRVVSLIEGDVATFNTTEGRERRRALQRIRSHLRHDRALRRRLAQIERPLSGITWTLTHLLELSRSSIDSPEPAAA